MHDAVAGGHQIDGTGLDPLHGAEAVAVVHGAAEQIGDRGQADMRVRADVAIAAAGLERRRAHMIKKDKGADALPAGGGQQPAHRKTDVAGMGFEQFHDEGLVRR